VPPWQDVTVGAQVRLAPEVAMTVATIEPGRSLVLRGGLPLGRTRAPFDSTWAFVLREQPDGTTRLVSRERYEYLRWWAALVVEPTSLISFVMSRKVLHGIAERAELTAPAMSTAGWRIFLPRPVDPDGPRAGLSGRLNRLRAGVLGANDGIVSTAGLVVGVAGATTTGAVLTAGIAGLVAGAVSMALGEYVSVSSQRDTEKSLLDREGAELEQFPPRSSPSSPGCTELRASAPRPRSGWPRN
jgi:hypothetical protein